MGPQARQYNHYILTNSFAFRVSVRGTHTPSYAHSAMMRAKDFLCYGLRQGPRSVSFVFWNFCSLHTPPLG
jgi:hypothetical protein